MIAAAATTIAACVYGAWAWAWLPTSDAPEAEQVRAVESALAARGVDLHLDGDAAILQWRPPSSCVEVYRVRVDETFRDASVAVFVGRAEEHASWTLALARGSSSRDEPVAVDALLIADDAPDLQERAARERRLWWSPRAVGPAAPDFACRRRGWDPLEDALALGWPVLPGRREAVGARWRGASVEGRCHETACVDERGEFSHERPCRARPWAEQLAGADADADADAALIVGSWDDGHARGGERGTDQAEIGILTSREAVIDEGRPLRVRATIEHRWSGVTRELELWRIDDCSARSLATADERSALARIRARLRQPPDG